MRGTPHTHYRANKFAQTDQVYDAVTACGKRKVKARLNMDSWEDVTCPVCLDNRVKKKR